MAGFSVQRRRGWNREYVEIYVLNKRCKLTWLRRLGPITKVITRHNITITTTTSSEQLFSILYIFPFLLVSGNGRKEVKISDEARKPFPTTPRFLPLRRGWVLDCWEVLSVLNRIIQLASDCRIGLTHFTFYTV